MPPIGESPAWLTGSRAGQEGGRNGAGSDRHHATGICGDDGVVCCCCRPRRGAPRAGLGGRAQTGGATDRQARGAHYYSGSEAVPEEVCRGPDASRAGEGGQAPTGGQAPARIGRGDGRQAPEGDREIRRPLAARVHGASGHREWEPDLLDGQDPDVRL